MSTHFELDTHLDILRETLRPGFERLLSGNSDTSQPPDNFLLRQAMNEAVMDGGKRVRPCLTLMAAEAVGGQRDDAVAPACAVELIHAYSLVHDDLPAMDNDEIRRGKPTCHIKYGEAAAILVGDALLTKAFEILATEGLRRADAARALLRAAAELARGAGVMGMVGGQAADIELKERDATFSQIEACHAQKTAALFEAACVVGALVGGADDDAVEALRRYGKNLGLAFQHADDLLDGDFEHYREQSLARARHLCAEAAQSITIFGDAGRPLQELAAFVDRRARFKSESKSDSTESDTTQLVTGSSAEERANKYDLSN